MKIKYEFVTGEKLEIEVEDNIGEIMVEMEVLQSRRNRTETRRHNSLATIKKFFIVQNEGERQVNRSVVHYNLQMIIAVGFKVNNDRAVRFRK